MVTALSDLAKFQWVGGPAPAALSSCNGEDISSKPPRGS